MGVGEVLIWGWGECCYGGGRSVVVGVAGVLLEGGGSVTMGVWCGGAMYYFLSACLTVSVTLTHKTLSVPP